MGMIDPMLMEFGHEMGSGRKMLELVPEKQLTFRPHPKSMSLGQLASHLAEIPGWAGVTLNMDVFEMDASYKPLNASTVKELLSVFDKNVASATTAMKGATDEQLLKTWTMKVAGKTVLTMPKIAVLRAFVFSHFIHHRAQLGVYLRMNNVPLPQVYGPTADATQM
jgi:uncharacterized damage-inducible protein DinB